MGVLNVGFFGGAFDPPHKGHEEIAFLSVSLLELDKLYICPTGGVLGDKRSGASNYKKRLQMATAAFSEIQKAKVVDWEQNEETSYTFDTVSNLIKNVSQPSNFFVIIGMDSFLSIRSWKNYKQLLELVNVVVFPRVGVSGLVAETLVCRLKKDGVNPDNLVFVKNNIVDVSSSGIKRSGVDVNKYLTKSVSDLLFKED